MILSEPQPTQADLRFQIADIPVRVSIGFWAMAALLGWNVSQSLAEGDQRAILYYLIAWIVVVFVSILIHELGHAVAYRAFGQSAQIVLYHFGGLAIPDRSTVGIRKPWKRLLISAAGPGSQLLLVVLVVIALRIGGYEFSFPIRYVGQWLGFDQGRPIDSVIAKVVIWHLLYVNIFWAAFNLLPVLPLDGGQITREALELAGIQDATRAAQILSIFAGAAVAWWAFQNQQTYVAFMFVMLAVSSYQAVNTSGPRWR